MKIYLHDFDELDRDFKVKFIKVLILLAFLFMALRLWYLQVHSYTRYEKVSTSNTLRKINSPAARGLIFDREGKLLTDNKPSYDLILYPDHASLPPKELTHAVAQLAGLELAKAEANIQREI